MAEAPIYLLIGDLTGTQGFGRVTFDQAVTAGNPPAQTSVLCSLYFPFVTGNDHTDWVKRSFGGDTGLVPQKHNDPVDPRSTGWHPMIWNHDSSFDATEPQINTITQGATTTIGLTLPAGAAYPHQRTDGHTIEVELVGVTGADAAVLNRTFLATFRGTSDLEIDVDTTGLALTPTGHVRIGQWFWFSDTVASVLRGVQNSDRSAGGGFREFTYDDDGRAAFGYEVTFAAEAHDHHGPLGERAHLFQHAMLPGLSSRVPASISAGTNASDAVLTAANHRLPQDVGKDFPVIVYGLTGSWAAANGARTARYVDDSTVILVGVDSSGWGALPAGGSLLAEQRGRKALGENYTDLVGRLDDSLQALADAGDTPRFDGVVLGLGRPEARDCAGLQTRIGDLQPSQVTTGFPTRITFAGPVQLSAPAVGKALLLAEITGGTAELNGRHEILVVSPTEIDVLVRTVDAVTAADVRLDVGDPSEWFLQDLVELNTDLRVDLAARSGQSTTDIPLGLVVPRFLVAAEWDGRPAYSSSSRVSTIVQQSVLRAQSEPQNISAIHTEDLSIRGTSTYQVANDGLAALGTRAFRELRRLADGVELRERGVPCYLEIGDSLAVGTVDFVAAWRSGDREFDGTHDAEARNARVFDQRTDRNEKYSAIINLGSSALPGNGNTFQVYDSSIAVGPEISLFLERAKAHDGTDVYFCKVAVIGSGITDNNTQEKSVSGVSVNGSTVTVQVPADPSGAEYGTGRNVPGQVVSISVSGMASAGIAGLPDGIYQATVVDFRTMTITQAGVSGSYTAGATIDVPQPDWRKSSADLWPYLVDIVQRWLQSILDEGKLPDVRGVFVWLGTNDALFGDPTQFSANAQQLIADLRQLCTTRSEPEADLGIIWQRVRNMPDAPGGAQAQQGIQAVQAALDQVVAADPRVESFSLDSPDPTDRQVTRMPLAPDGIHLTWEGHIYAGYTANDAAERLGLPGNGGAAAAAASSGGAVAEASAGGGSVAAASTSGGSEAFAISGATSIEIARAVIAACDQAILDGVHTLSYTINGRTFTRQSLSEITRTRQHYVDWLRRQEGGSTAVGTLL